MLSHQSQRSPTDETVLPVDRIDENAGNRSVVLDPGELGATRADDVYGVERTIGEDEAVKVTGGIASRCSLRA